MRHSLYLKCFIWFISVTLSFQCNAVNEEISASAVKTVLIHNSSTRLMQIYLEFKIKGDYEVDTIRLYYRESQKQNYLSQDLIRNISLNYGITLPFMNKIEYYFEITPERGGKLYVYSPSTPAIIFPNTFNVENTEKVKTFPSAGNSFLTGVLVFIAAILGAGIAKKAH